MGYRDVVVQSDYGVKTCICHVGLAIPGYWVLTCFDNVAKSFEPAARETNKEGFINIYPAHIYLFL